MKTNVCRNQENTHTHTYRTQETSMKDKLRLSLIWESFEMRKKGQKVTQFTSTTLKLG